MTGETLARFGQGDREVFRRAVEQITPLLLVRARSFARDHDDAHELVQQTWVRVFERRTTYRASGSLFGWIVTIHRSVCLSAVKTTARQRRVREASDTFPEPPDPGVEVLGRAASDAVRAAVDALPERERDVVYLRFLRECSTRETAEKLGIAEGTVKATLHHAMKKLRNSMEAWAP